MAWLIVMCSCGLVKLVALFTKAVLEGPLGLSNISLFTVIFFAFQHIYYIVAVACTFSVELPCASFIILHIHPLKNIRTSSALIFALLHSFGGLKSGFKGTFALIRYSLIIFGLVYNFTKFKVVKLSEVANKTNIYMLST